MGFANSSDTNSISYKKYAKNFCFFVFMLTNSQEDSAGFELVLFKNFFIIIFVSKVRDGSTSIHIRFLNLKIIKTLFSTALTLLYLREEYK